MGAAARRQWRLPVTIRVVKGANMEMERVEASIEGWARATYVDKVDTDANFKRMLQFGMSPGNVEAVRLGVASHNLFDVAYALVLASTRGAVDAVQFEMLEGMANHQRRALSEVADNVLLYAPATRREEFVNAIGYLIRRLDENTGPDNFLRHAFKLEVDSDDWKRLEAGFIDSFQRIDTLSEAPRRTQDRSRTQARSRAEGATPPPVSTSASTTNGAADTTAAATLSTADFVNEADTDFSLPANLRWIEQVRQRWIVRHGDAAVRVGLVVAGKTITEGRALRDCLDPSRPGTVVGRYLQADEADIDQALQCANLDPCGWRALDVHQRGRILADVAQQLRDARGDLMGAAMADGGKLFTQSDPEVSEAIDFVEYYAATARDFFALDTVDAAPKGVVVVVPPWNFPIAIPCGGIAAALAAGNNVIVKPASHTVLVAWELCQAFWRGGVPREALQFVPCRGAVGGAKLAASELVDVVILTGGTSTALRMLEVRPEMNLLAETGGKNATIVTAMSDREQAIKHVLQSAFGHTGQKCSATSLLILEAEVYDDASFKKTLCDAARSMHVGSAWDYHTKIGPLVHPPDGDLERALKELEKGESWALMPRRLADNPNLYSPAIKWGVTAGSYTHMTEFFGPVLAVLRADNLAHAIQLVNETGYGLTSGIESLDDREVASWRDSIVAGNLYINRMTTGAIVQRQPFGGVGKSAFGPGIKAGGPNYVAQLMDFRDREGSMSVSKTLVDADLEALRRALVADGVGAAADHHGCDGEQRQRILRAMVSYDEAFADEFGVMHDHVKLVGQDNHRRYRPLDGVRIRVHPDDSAFDIYARVCAAKTVGSGITLSLPPGYRPAAVVWLDTQTESWGAAIEFVEESDEVLQKEIAHRQTDRVRYAHPDRVPRSIYQAVADTGVHIARWPVLAEGRIELLWYLSEQSISHNYHRYGNLGVRATEPRSPVR